MKLYKIVYILIFSIFSLSSNAQTIFRPENFKLSKMFFENNFKTFSPLYSKSPNVSVNPNTSKYPISNFITDIFVTGDTVYFGTGSGIMRTIDKFSHFQNYYGLAPFGEDDVAGFAINKNILVVATATTVEISGDNVPTGTGIKVSTDYGVNWNSFGQPIDGRYDSSIVYGSNTLYTLPVVVPQQNLSYDIAITKTKNNPNNYTIWIASFAGGIRKSDDYGATWQRIVLPPDNLDSIYIGGTYNFALNVNDSYNHRAFSIYAVNDSTLFVGTAGGINKSTDWGVSWRKYSYQNSGTGTNRVAGNFVVKFHQQKFGSSRIIWAATRKADDPNEINAISYSTNNGFSWSYTLKDIAPNGIGSLDSLVYALTDEGIWRSYFGNFNWSKPGLIYDEETRDICKANSFYYINNIHDTLYIGSSDGLLRIKETGQPWVSKWKIYRALKEIDLSSDIRSYAAPNPFAPNTEYTRIFYKTGKNISKITIRIFDFGMNPTRTIIRNAVRTSPEELYTIWDGLNGNGYQIANGVYFYRIEIEGEKDEWGKIIVLQ
jgi:hypothetical protein